MNASTPRTPLDEICAFESDLVVTAGAGTGKTFALVRLFLHLTAGTTALKRPLDPRRIIALTFTNKAAAEMRSRVELAITSLAEQTEESSANRRIIAEAAARLEVPEPTIEQWRETLALLPQTVFSTYHSFAAAEVKRFSLQLGLDPRFEMLETEEQKQMEHRAIESAAIELFDEKSDYSTLLEHFRLRAKQGDSLFGAAAALLGSAAEFGLSTVRRAYATESVIALTTDQIAVVLRELEQLSPPKSYKASAAATFAEKKSELANTLRSARNDALALATSHANRPEFGDLVVELVAKTRRVVLEIQKLRGRRTKDSVADAVAAEQALGETLGDLLAIGPTGALEQLIARAEIHYRREKQAVSALDFADLMTLLKQICVEPESKRALGQRFDAVLVDEFQDSSRVQTAIVEALTSEGARRFLVGDAKQAIYDFRGADVTIFQAAVPETIARGGARIVLSENRRSRPGLLRFANRLFADLLSQTGNPFDVVFDPDSDALKPTRQESGEPVVELLSASSAADSDNQSSSDAANAATDGTVAQRSKSSQKRKRPLAAEQRANEARAIATRILALRSEGKARFGDIALLFRVFSNVRIYLAALSSMQIPHFVVRGGGFFAAQEICDLAAAMTFLDQPDQPIPLLTLLRSPLVALSDRSLFELTSNADQQHGSAKLSRHRLRSACKRGELPTNELYRLERWLDLSERLSASQEQLGPEGILRAILNETDYLAVMAGGEGAEQKLANIRQLCRLAQNSAKNCHLFAAELWQQVVRGDKADEAQALPESADVVRVMTIHQSKGLEFPVVFLPDIGSTERVHTSMWAYDRALGLGLSLRSINKKEPKAASFSRILDESKRRSAAQNRRLFYVGVTRARERLILSGELSSRPNGMSWRQAVDPLFQNPGDLAADLSIIQIDQLLAASTKSPVPIFSDPAHAATSAEKRDPQASINYLPIARSGSTFSKISVSVTALSDFAQCGRRFRNRHEWGLEEHPRSEEESEIRSQERFVDTSQLVELDARNRGTTMHRLLELVDLSHAKESIRDALIQAANRIAQPGAAPVEPSLLEHAERFLKQPFARELLFESTNTIDRERPFHLLIQSSESAPHKARLLLTGQIDLLVKTDKKTVILDYKYSKSSAHRNYEFQLACYALAVAKGQSDGDERALRTEAPNTLQVGLVYLLDPDPKPKLITITQARLQEIYGELATLGEALAVARSSNRWAPVSRSRCDEIQCGYRFHCWTLPHQTS